jgi:hypothetical protein
MSPLGLSLVVCGLVLVAFGLSRARAPLARYQALRALDANAERYRAWRGGPRDGTGDTTGADVMKSILRSRIRASFLIATAGVAVALAGLLVR